MIVATIPHMPRRRRPRIVVATLALGLLLVACGGSVDDSASTSTGPTEASTTVTTSPPTTTAAPTTTLGKVWGPADFKVELITLESQCFDTAGAVVTVEPELVKVSLLEVEVPLTIVYEIRGGENVDTYRLQLAPSGTYSFSEHVIQTVRCDDELTAEVVNVIQR